MKFLEVFIGILIAPFGWVYERLINGNPPSPPEFWFLIKCLNESGITAQLQMQQLTVAGITHSAIIVIGEPAQNNVLNLFKLDSEQIAREKLSEVQSNPLMSHAMQRDCYLMSVTFLEPNEELAASVVAAFREFRLPPNKSLQDNAA